MYFFNFTTFNDDGEEASKHTDCLEDISPHYSFDSSDCGIEDTNSKDHKAGNVQIETSNLHRNMILYIVEFSIFKPSCK